MTVFWRALAAACLLAVIVDGLHRSRPSGELRDFGSFVGSAHAGAASENPYGIHPLTFHVVLPGFDVWNPNLNPPVSVLLFRAFGALPPHEAFRWWWSASLACYLLTVALLWQRHRGDDIWLLSLWALALAGVWDTLALGQIYMPLVLAATAAWLLLERGHAVWAGVLIGVVCAIKPNFAAWPAVLLLSGHVRAPVAAVGSAAALSAVPLITHGAVIYRQWGDVILADETRTAFLTNASLLGLSQRLGMPGFGVTLSLLTLATLAVWAYRRRPAALDASALGIAAGIAASPIAWVHYTLFLLPVFFNLRMPPALLPAAILLVVPVAGVLRFLDAPLWQQATIGSAYSWAVIACLAALVWRLHRIEQVIRPGCRSARGTRGRRVPA